MCRWVAEASLARARWLLKNDGSGEWAARKQASTRAQSPWFRGVAASFISFSKDLNDNLLIDSQIDCQCGKTKGAERAWSPFRSCFRLVIENVKPNQLPHNCRYSRRIASYLSSSCIIAADIFVRPTTGALWCHFRPICHNFLGIYLLNSKYISVDYDSKVTRSSKPIQIELLKPPNLVRTRLICVSTDLLQRTYDPRQYRFHSVSKIGGNVLSSSMEVWRIHDEHHWSF